MLELRVRDLVMRGAAGGDGARPILKASSLDVPSGQRLGVRGPSGAGKSTLLYAVCGASPVASGAVCWGDADLAQMGESARDAFRRAHIGMMFQEAHLFEELTPLENAALVERFAPAAERHVIRTRARAALERLGAPLERSRVSAMSGGERQRVALARALATAPPVLIADEPTASLDRSAANEMIKALVDASGPDTATLLVVSHDDALLEAMDRVVEVRDGVLR